MYRIKERVKAGELSPEQAEDLIKKQFYGVPERLLKWLRGPGAERYRQAKKGERDE